MKLVIAEKPSLAREIAAAVGNPRPMSGYIDAGNGIYVTWCVGHLLEQVMPDGYDPKYEKWVLEHLPFIPEKWKLASKPSTASQLAVIEGLLKKAQSVVHAGDPDREGQLIVDEVLNQFHYKGPVDRLWVQDLTKLGIQKAWDKAEPGEKYRNLFLAALARQRADFVLGINLTRAYSIAWGRAGNRGALHVGRVLTPTLGLIVNRDLAIENFKAKDYYTLALKVQHQNGEFSASWQVPEDATFVDSDGRVIDRAAAQAVATKLHGAAGVITQLKVERKRQLQPLPFTLAGLQKLGTKLGMTPQKVLDVCQSLYETHKMLSYPRSDCHYLSSGDYEKSPKVLAAIRVNADKLLVVPPGLDESIRSHAFDDKKLGAHTGIVPTTTIKSLQELNRDEQVIYKIVAKQYLAQFYPVREYDATSLLIDVSDEKLKATGRQEVNLGWRILFQGDAEEDGEASLPLMKKDDEVKVVAATVESKKTSPPPRFDGSSLIDAMENIHKFVTKEDVKRRLKDGGLGTPATRGVIIENIEKREYVKVIKDGKRNVMISTEKCRQLIKVLPQEVSEPDLTAYFEMLLSQIEEGSLDLERFEAQQAKFVTKLVEAVKSGEVPKNMPKLEVTAPIKLSRPGAKKATSATGKGGEGAKPSSSTSRAKSASSSKGSGGQSAADACPTCGVGSLFLRKGTSKAGKPYEFYGCTKFPTCKHTQNGK